jgi:hypothetical protein
MTTFQGHYVILMERLKLWRPLGEGNLKTSLAPRPFSLPPTVFLAGNYGVNELANHMAAADFAGLDSGLKHGEFKEAGLTRSRAK